MTCVGASLRNQREHKKILEDEDTEPGRLQFLLVVSWMYHYYDDIDRLYLDSIWSYEDVPEQTTMFLTRQDSYCEIKTMGR